MEKQTAEKAREILRKISRTEDKIKELEKMKDWKLELCTNHYRNSLAIPDELQDIVYVLVKTFFENDLNKIEKELRGLQDHPTEKGGAE